jgi:hypothetical protein
MADKSQSFSDLLQCELEGVSRLLQSYINGLERDGP